MNQIVGSYLFLLVLTFVFCFVPVWFKQKHPITKDQILLLLLIPIFLGVVIYLLSVSAWFLAVLIVGPTLYSRLDDFRKARRSRQAKAASPPPPKPPPKSERPPDPPRAKRPTDAEIDGAAQFGLHLYELFETLEVEPTADAQVLKSAFRRVLLKYHPDKAAHMAQGFQDFAHERTQRILKAHELLSQYLAVPGFAVALERLRPGMMEDARRKSAG